MNRIEIGLLMLMTVGVGCADAGGTSAPQTGVPADLTEPTIVEPAPSVIETPTTDDPPILEPTGQTLDCVSAFVTHNGSYYAATVTQVDDGTLVEISRVELATSEVTGVGAGEAKDETSEVVWSDVVEARLSDGFFGFEREDMFLVAQAEERAGLYTGSIGGESELHDAAIPLTCWSPELVVPARYDAESGDCVNDQGEPSKNDLPFAYALRTGFGQCSQFEGQLNGDAYGYPSFIGLDLRGADLSAAALYFGHFINVDLCGADMSTFSFGYATVRGTIDDYTTVPVEGGCSDPVSEQIFDCTQ